MTVTKTTKKATIDYGKIEPATWSNDAQTVAASKFPLNKIYDAEDVKLTLTEFQALTGEVVKEVTDKVYFAISTDPSSKNELTAVIAAQTPANPSSPCVKNTPRRNRVKDLACESQSFQFCSSYRKGYLPYFPQVSLFFIS